MPRKTAEELLDFIKGEENLMGTQSKATVGSDEDDIKTGDKVTNMALHYANKGNTMLVRLDSKWDLKRQ